MRGPEAAKPRAILPPHPNPLPPGERGSVFKHPQLCLLKSPKFISGPLTASYRERKRERLRGRSLGRGGAVAQQSSQCSSFFSSPSNSVILMLRLTTLPDWSTRIIVGTVRIPKALAGRLSSPPSSKICGQSSLFPAR